MLSVLVTRVVSNLIGLTFFKCIFIFKSIRPVSKVSLETIDQRVFTFKHGPEQVKVICYQQSMNRSSMSPSWYGEIHVKTNELLEFSIKV